MSIFPGELNVASLYALRHYVSLSCYARSNMIFKARNGLAMPVVYSGFVMQVQGEWFLVTAGHVLDSIANSRKSGVELVDFRLWDWVIGSRKERYLPFGFDDAMTFRIDKDGLDYGLIQLRPFYVNGLKATGVCAVGEEHYERHWPAEFHAYAMIGTPEATVTLERIGERDTRLTHSVCALHIAEVPNPPDELVKPAKRFYGSILAGEDSQEWQGIGSNVTGMSGGPIIAFRKERDGLKYWVIAVQSAWLQSRRIIAGCYFQQFAEMVSCAFREAAQKPRSTQTERDGEMSN